MTPLLENSLLIRLGLAMAAITLLGFLTMLGTAIIVEMAQGEAAAINQAGSLRMQSHRIATQLAIRGETDARSYGIKMVQLVDEFQQRLTHNRLRSAIPTEKDHALNQAYEQIQTQWVKEIHPMLRTYTDIMKAEYSSADGTVVIPGAEATLKKTQTRYLGLVDDFVGNIDRLVYLLEDSAEMKIRWLRTLQITSLFLILVVVFRTMYLMHTIVLIPLYKLLDFAQHARSGDLSKRVETMNEDELGHLGRAFNGMADELTKIHANLEHRVQMKTADLERSNRSLELLYKTTSRLNDTGLSKSIYQELLEDIERLVGLGPGVICLYGEPGQDAITLASTRKQDNEVPDICSNKKCSACIQLETSEIRTLRVKGKAQEALAVPIKDQDKQYGTLVLNIPSSQAIKRWQPQLIEAVAGHIGLAISLANRVANDRRLALHEERNVIARELHDSLAQSLSYLKIQGSRLEASLAQGNRTVDTNSVVAEIREGISSAYQQLRELLATFRLSMDGRGLAQALEETSKEYRELSRLPVQLIYDMHGYQLDPSAEIHVLQVVREALSNVLHHAAADTVMIKARFDPTIEFVQVIVEDDGVGIAPLPERPHHYGLAIMDERARGLGGAITITRCASGGTRVELSFPAPQTMTQVGAPEKRLSNVAP